MAHDHSHTGDGHTHAGHHHDDDLGFHAPLGVHVHSPLKNITAAFVLNFIFTLIEFAGGILTGSVSVMANAIHDLGDTASFGSALYFEKVSQKRRDEGYSFGYRRFALLSALISGVLIMAGSIVVLKESLPRFFHPEEVKPVGMLILSVLGVAFNGWAAFGLLKGKSHHEKILTWHLMEDAAGWGLVLVGAFVIRLKGWFWLDPLMACGLSVVVMFNVVRNLRETFEVLLQRAPRQFDEKAFLAFVNKVEGVSGVHDLHVWSMDGERHILSLHIVLNPNASRKVCDIKGEIQNFVSEIGNFHTTIETEDPEDDCNENCDEN